MYIKLNSKIFDKNREARHHEGMLELGSVDEEIIERNKLITLLHKTHDDVQHAQINDPTRLKIESVNILNEKENEVRDLKEKYVDLVSIIHFYTCIDT